MSLFINVLVKNDIQILAAGPKSYAFHRRSPSSLKTEEKGFPVPLKFEFSNPDHAAIKDELVQGKDAKRTSKTNLK
jgi:hypothetical protein